MNFFEQQDIARRNTRALVLFFLAAVVLLIVLTNAAVAAFMWFGRDYNVYSGSSEGLDGFLNYFSWSRFGTIGLAVTATVAMVALLKWLSLSSGGKVVAESMGGSRILPPTRDPGEQRCLNIVEEIALAATMPVAISNPVSGPSGTNPPAAIIADSTVVIKIITTIRGLVNWR